MPSETLSTTETLSELFAKSAGRRNSGQSADALTDNNEADTVSNDKTVKPVNVKKHVKKKLQIRKQTVSTEEQKWLFDPWILLFSISILAIGIVMVSSASISIAERNNGEPFYYLYRQLIATGLGAVLGILVLVTPIYFWQKVSPLILMAGIMLLVAVLIPGIGKEINGSARWISMGIFNLQVSELVKLSMVIYLAGYLVRQNDKLKGAFKGFVIPMTVLAIVAVLLLLEPDLGAAVVISVTALGMLFIGGVRLWQVFLLMLLMGVCVYLLVIFEPYRLERLQSFMNPWDDPYNSGFQLTQSLIAFGRGELTGVGLGNSIQKLFYLPEAHTDFLFAGLVSRIFVLASRADELKRYYSAYMMYGLGIWIGLQAFVNIAVNMGALPTKGLTLPLMSYGGSSMMIMCIVIALILRAEHELRFKTTFGSSRVRTFFDSFNDTKMGKQI